VRALSSADIFLFEGFRLDGRGLFRRDKDSAAAPVEIGSRALDVLRVLAERPGDLLSRHEIMAVAWPGILVDDNNLTIQIVALRRVLDHSRTEDSSCILTIPGRGYRLVAPVTRTEPAGRPLGPAPRLSIVVLPFNNLSDDPEQQYFADGITEDLTTDLSRLPHMAVISRNTAFTYRNRCIDTRQIGDELGARYVLQGSARRSGNHVRVSVQLIDVATDTNLWAERFDCGTGDLLALQDEITGRIASELKIELIAAEDARPTDNPEALDYIFRGRAVRLRPNSRGVYAKAVGMFERALALDSGSVEAQSLLASTLATRMLDGVTDSEAVDLARAERLVHRALAASPRNPTAHMAKGDVLRARGCSAEAIGEYETVLAINRNDTDALDFLADCKLLRGSMEDVIPLEEQAIRLSPRDPRLGYFCFRIGQAQLLQSRTDEALPWLESACRAVPELPFPHALLASTCGLKGETERAAAELAEARRLSNYQRYMSRAQMKGFIVWQGAASMVRDFAEATFFPGLRQAGTPKE
jgi:TolB-like protein